MKHIDKAKLVQIVNWLTEYAGTGVYDADSTRASWDKCIGIDRPNWPEHSYEDTKRAITERGLKTDLWGSAMSMYVFGWELARCLSWEYAAYVSDRNGPGASFWDHLNALRNAEMIATMV